MNVTITIDNSQLSIINNVMAELDQIVFNGLKRLVEFDIYFDSTPGSYSANTLTIVKNQLHQQLQ